MVAIQGLVSKFLIFAILMEASQYLQNVFF